MHCHPPLEPPASPWEPGGSVDSRALCQHPSSRGSITSCQVTLLSVSPPSPKSCCRERWGWLVLLEAVAHCVPPVPGMCAGVYVHHPRLLWDMCHPLPHSRASSDAITVLWTVLTQEGCLDIWPLPFGMAFPLSLPSQDTGPQCTSLSLHLPLCLHFPLPSLPQFPPRTQDSGWLAVTGVEP